MAHDRGFGWPVATLVVTLGLAATANAAPPVTVGPGCTYATIAEGIAAVSPGGTVYLKGGAYFEERLVIAKNLTLAGGYEGCVSGTSEPTMISGSHSGTVIVIEGGLEVHLEQLAIIRGSTGGSGGGITFAATGDGLLVLEDVSIGNCDADNGGGVWVGPGAELIANRVWFSRNEAYYGGGAIRLYGGRASLRNCTFGNNKARWGGAISGIKASGMSPEVTAAEVTVFRENENLFSSGMGGAVHLEEGELVAAQDTVFDNNAGSYGGAVYLLDSVFRGGGHFYQNSADDDGGALYVNHSIVELHDGPMFSNNTATADGGGSGGAAFITNSSVVSIRDGAAVGNSSRASGGAFWLQYGSRLEIRRSSNACRWAACHQLSGNISQEWFGGAIGGNGEVLLDGQLLEGNIGAKVGALYFAGDAVVSGCVFTGNDSIDPEYGDAVHLEGESASFIGTGVTFAYNDEAAGSSGEAIKVTHRATLALDASIVWGHGLGINDFNQTVTCSDIEGGYPGVGNIAVDPQFVEPLAGNFHLQPTSPLIDRCDGPAERSGDVDWQVRPWFISEPDTPYDMGADEVGSVSIEIFTDGFENGDTSGWS